MDVAKKRVTSRGWDGFVSVVLGDACDFNCPGLPESGTVDVVTFSYALSMIPDWKQAIRNAHRMLKMVGLSLICSCNSVSLNRYNVDILEWSYCSLRLYCVSKSMVRYVSILDMDIFS